MKGNRRLFQTGKAVDETSQDRLQDELYCPQILFRRRPPGKMEMLK